MMMLTLTLTMTMLVMMMMLVMLLVMTMTMTMTMMMTDGRGPVRFALRLQDARRAGEPAEHQGLPADQLEAAKGNMQGEGTQVYSVHGMSH